MMRRVLFFFLLTQPLVAQDELRWKWRADDTFYVKTVTKVEQAMVLEDPKASRLFKERELKQDYEHVSWMRYTVSKRNADGSAILLQRVVKDHSEVGPADSLKVDNTLDNVELTLHVDARGIVSKVEGGDVLLEKLAGNDTGKREALREALSPDSLKAAATQALGIMPSKDVKAGEKWDVPGELKLGALGRVKLERTITLDSVANKGATKIAQLSFTTRVADYQPAKTGGNTFRITEGSLSQGEGKGTIELDLDAGRLRKAESTMNLKGQIAFLNTSTVYRAQFTQKQTVTVTVHDKIPPKEEPK